MADDGESEKLLVLFINSGKWIARPSKVYDRISNRFNKQQKILEWTRGKRVGYELWELESSESGISRPRIISLATVKYIILKVVICICTLTKVNYIIF